MFSLGDMAAHSIAPRTMAQKATISGFIRENPGVLVAASNVNSWGNLPTPSVAEKAAKLLTALGRKFTEPGAIIRVDCTQLEIQLGFANALAAEGKSEKILFPDACCEASEWVATAWATTPAELDYLLRDFLQTQHWLSKKSDGFVITPSGWQQIEDWKLKPSQSVTAFIAMSFAKTPDLLALFENGIEPGIRAAGYRAVRVDQVEHVNRIDDEIMAMIRKSKFVVADFTDNNRGVYFEAGFAQGLGRKVIWTVREDHLEKDLLHFDTRQFNFIPWRAGELEAFATALQHRIEGAIEPGPLKVETTTV